MKGFDCPGCGRSLARIDCPACGASLPRVPFPLLTVDCLARNAAGEVLLVKRRFPPHGWALPGGFVEAGETLEKAVSRELVEETGLEPANLEQFRAYSDPARDPRHHIITVVFTGRVTGVPRAGDDAAQARFFALDTLPLPMAADHGEILAGFRSALLAGRFPDPPMPTT